MNTVPSCFVPILGFWVWSPRPAAPHSPRAWPRAISLLYLGFTDRRCRRGDQSTEWRQQACNELLHELTIIATGRNCPLSAWSAL